jgi:hypothetical protein
MKKLLIGLLFVSTSACPAGLGNLFNELSKKPVAVPQAPPKPPVAPQPPKSPTQPVKK